MDVFSKIQTVLDKTNLVGAVFSDAKTVRDLMTQLDEVHKRSEKDLGTLEGEIHRAYGIQHKKTELGKGPELDSVQKKFNKNALARLKTHIENMERRMKIMHDNLTLYLRLMGKIQEVEAMAMCGVQDEQIDEIMVEFELRVTEHQEAVRAGVSMNKEREEEQEDPKRVAARVHVREKVRKRRAEEKAGEAPTFDGKEEPEREKVLEG